MSNSVFHTIRELKLLVRVLVFSVMNVIHGLKRSRTFSYGTYALYHLLSAQESDKRGSARRVVQVGHLSQVSTFDLFELLSQFFFPNLSFQNSGCGLSASAAYTPVFTVVFY